MIRLGSVSTAYHRLPLLYGARRALYVVETTFSSKFESYSAHHCHFPTFAEGPFFLVGSQSTISPTMSFSSDESTRLQGLYSTMSDGELEQIEADSVSLTDVARTALATELQRRRLSNPDPSQPTDSPEAEVEFQHLVPVRKFRDLPEALLAKGSLDSAGIECHLGDDNMVRMDWFISNLLGGVKLLVKPEDAEAADEILDQPIPENFDVDGIGNYESPECPKCHSLDVSFQELNKPVAYTSAWIAVPIPLHRKAWKCHACGAEWEHTDPAQDEEP